MEFKALTAQLRSFTAPCMGGHTGFELTSSTWRGRASIAYLAGELCGKGCVGASAVVLC